MRGKQSPAIRPIQPDERYKSVVVAKMINRLMVSGKKTTARDIVYRALEQLEQSARMPAVQALEIALKNVAPLVEVRSKRIGGATYQVPMEVRPNRKEALTMRWIIGAARSRQGKPMAQLLAEELLDAFNSTGAAMKKREDIHKMAEANKAFAHFARF